MKWGQRKWVPGNKRREWRTNGAKGGNNREGNHVKIDIVWYSK